MLKFNGTWRFDSPGEIRYGVVNEFSTLIGKRFGKGVHLQFDIAPGARAFGSKAACFTDNAKWHPLVTEDELAVCAKRLTGRRLAG